MFEKLRNAFSNASKSFGEKELKEKDIEDIISELEIALLESDVAIEVTDIIKADLKSRLIGTRVDKNTIETFVRDSLIQTISSLFDDAGNVDLFANIDKFKEKNEPYIILFVGINGTGKTTSLAKVANLLQKSKYSLVVAAADTYRAGAIEQLKEHTKRLNLKIIAQNYGSDPAAVSRDAVLYAKSHKINCVLIDTAGRMQTSKNLMEQIEKITHVVKPNLKIFVGDSLSGNNTVNQAKEFYQHIKFDGTILTKSDADARGGAALSIVKITKTPVMFVGVGQEYDDLKIFDKNLFLETVFGNISDVNLTKDAQLEPPPHETTQIQSEKTTETQQETQPQETTQQEIQPQETTQQETQPQPQETTQQETQPQPQETTQQETQPQPQETTQQETTDDPFEGINDNDIAKYADLYDVPPPESNVDATKMAKAIKEWIKNGKPKPNEQSKDNTEDKSDHDNTEDKSDHDNTEDKLDHDNTEDKSDHDNTEDAIDQQPKKKRKIFGFFKK